MSGIQPAGRKGNDDSLYEQQILLNGRYDKKETCEQDVNIMKYQLRKMICAALVFCLAFSLQAAGA